MDGLERFYLRHFWLLGMSVYFPFVSFSPPSILHSMIPVTSFFRDGHHEIVVPLQIICFFGIYIFLILILIFLSEHVEMSLDFTL